MNKEPETYEELIRQKRCIDLTKYYELSMDDLNKIYTFLEENKDGQVRGGLTELSLVKKNVKENETMKVNLINKSIDGLVMDNEKFSLIPHYEPTTWSSSGYSGSYSGGSSNNNNNNNNNNNIINNR